MSISGKKISAVIAEYNPFHNGHKYHIEQTRKAGADLVIAVMSGNTVQRGDIAVFDKHTRARLAVSNGADLVIELPYPYSCSCAEVFARGAVSIISRLGVVDMLSFGCETDSLEILTQCAEISKKMKDESLIEQYTSTGLSYPTAFEKAVRERYGDTFANAFSSPNNTLAIEYIKALSDKAPQIKPVCIKRFGAMHDSMSEDGTIASASLIRTRLANGENADALVPYILSGLDECILDRMSGAIIMRISQLVYSGEFASVPDFTQELADRIKKVLSQDKITLFSELISAVKSKSFTYAKTSRAMLNGYIGLEYSDLEREPYARVLAFNANGQQMLKKIQKSQSIEVSASLADFSDKRLAQLDDLTARLQGFCRRDAVFVNEFKHRFDGFVR